MMIAGEPGQVPNVGQAPVIGEVAWRLQTGANEEAGYFVPNGKPWRVYAGTAIKTERLLAGLGDPALYDRVEEFEPIAWAASELGVNQ